MRINGVDSIVAADCPKLDSIVEVSKDVISIGDRLLLLWNLVGMSFIPYCSKCATSLDWYSPPDGDKIFECRICGRVWIMDNEWLVERMRSGE